MKNDYISGKENAFPDVDITDCDILTLTSSQEKHLLQEIQCWNNANVSNEVTQTVSKKEVTVSKTKPTTAIQPRSQPVFNFNNSSCTVNVYYQN